MLIQPPAHSMNEPESQIRVALTTSRFPCFLILRQIKTCRHHDLHLGQLHAVINSSSIDTAVSFRSGLPSEALEEFLSILRPSFFSPTSPVLRTRRQGVSLPTLQHERSFYRSRGRLEIVPQKNEDKEELDNSRSTQPSRNACSSTPDPHNDIDGLAEADTDSPPVRWFKANILCMFPYLANLNTILDHNSSFSNLSYPYAESLPSTCFQSVAEEYISPFPSCDTASTPYS
jgi:hypothetical protein